eukprot:GHVN01050477.1.p1 GENE.GHVN01050477.1~~GHVN01050477.1.p1  ORF type:complete len:250 (+),score=11.41 GHVN01050477.1:655-1404(+)
MSSSVGALVDKYILNFLRYFCFHMGFGHTRGFMDTKRYDDMSPRPLFRQRRYAVVTEWHVLPRYDDAFNFALRNYLRCSQMQPGHYQTQLFIPYDMSSQRSNAWFNKIFKRKDVVIETMMAMRSREGRKALLDYSNGEEQAEGDEAQDQVNFEEFYNAKHGLDLPPYVDPNKPRTYYTLNKYLNVDCLKKIDDHPDAISLLGSIPHENEYQPIMFKVILDDTDDINIGSARIVANNIRDKFAEVVDRTV